MTQYTLCLLMKNKPDTLARVTGLFSAKNCRIFSLLAEMTRDRAATRMKITINAHDPDQVEQMRRHLRRLVDTISVQ